MKTKKMFYVVEVSYVGPNREQNWDADEIQIRTKPALTNMSYEERIDGWCGTTNDWSTYAYGVYETLEAAEDRIKEKFGPVRDTDILDEPFITQHEPIFADDPDDPGIVAVFKAGKLYPAHPEVADQWAYDWRDEARAPDADIEAIFQDMETQANAENMTFANTKDLIISLLEGYQNEENRE